jgi:hypothetical protein
LFDIDFFKKINDNFGHSAGDYVLKTLGDIVSTKLVRANDYFARYGGEEFVAVIAANDLESATRVFERARSKIEQFQVPQVGRVTILVLSLPLVFAIILGAPIAGLAVALAFYKINGKPFIEILESGLVYFLGGRLYLWKKEKEPVAPKIEAVAPAPLPKAPLSRRKLEELAWSLDVRDTGQNPQ